MKRLKQLIAAAGTALVLATGATPARAVTLPDCGHPFLCLSVSNAATVVEGNSGTRLVTFELTLNKPDTLPIRVEYQTVDGTATGGNSLVGPDYVSVRAVQTFAPGETRKTVSVLVNGDLLGENSEIFYLDVTDPERAAIKDGRGQVKIVDDDPPTLFVSDAAVTEGHAGNRSMSFVVSLSKTPVQAVTVNYSTANGTAFEGADYVRTSGTLQFAADTSALQRTINVPIAGDELREGLETLFLNLSGPNEAGIGDAQGRGIIHDDEPVACPPSLPNCQEK